MTRYALLELTAGGCEETFAGDGCVYGLDCDDGFPSV